LHERPVIPRAVCLVTPVEEPVRFARAQAHFAEVGLAPDYFHGLHKSQSGLVTSHLYMVDRPDPDAPPYRIGSHATHIWLGHYFIWQALKLSGDPAWLVLECDAKFPPDWRGRAEAALAFLHLHDADFDVLYLGSCCCADKQRTHVAGPKNGGIWVVHGPGPQCAHAYIVRAKAVPTLERTLRKVWAPIDIQQPSECFEHGTVLPRSLPFDASTRRLKAYVVLPRIVEQWDNEIPP
jgi:hypothetical protein